jgi:GntR family transcriptional regulator, arabinose operon transcriptional repressor
MNGPKPKYREIFDRLVADIRSGRYKPGQRFPSEAALVTRFEASRITVGRAVRELQQSGFVDRVAGSGTFVRDRAQQSREGLLFGLIIPDLGETEIFEPICQGIARSNAAAGHALLWAHADAGESDRAKQALELCRQSISRSVAGVFFAPLELDARAKQVNRHVLESLRKAGIPVVLLDRRPEEPSSGMRCDLVGIDNHRAGFLATEHVLNAGARRVVFASFSQQASSVDSRIRGYRDALAMHGRESVAEWVFPYLKGEALPLPSKKTRFDAVVCANDKIAGGVMHSLLNRGVRIPEDVRIVGIDDVAYASLLPVPLTTVHQPCHDIGEAALHTMLERIDRPRTTARNVLLDCWFFVRRSGGAAATPGNQ